MVGRHRSVTFLCVVNWVKATFLNQNRTKIWLSDNPHVGNCKVFFTVLCLFMFLFQSQVMWNKFLSSATQLSEYSWYFVVWFKNLSNIKSRTSSLSCLYLFFALFMWNWRTEERRKIVACYECGLVWWFYILVAILLLWEKHL